MEWESRPPWETEFLVIDGAMGIELLMFGRYFTHHHTTTIIIIYIARRPCGTQQEI